ncbi:hypothetical protein [Sutcliffiella halmapala]|uniref:hypothetical protein n=1 Tax=Sutcliffiella halmapala TaxID=79882 RepID=UPI000995AAAB|nr:hypothetical protein [Sutcliffiella halmapala]
MKKYITLFILIFSALSLLIYVFNVAFFFRSIYGIIAFSFIFVALNWLFDGIFGSKSEKKKL